MFLACRHGIPLRAEDEGENMKRNLIILNPCSGKKRANRYLTDIVDLFTKEGYMSTVLTTTARGGRNFICGSICRGLRSDNVYRRRRNF